MKTLSFEEEQDFVIQHKELARSTAKTINYEHKNKIKFVDNSFDQTYTLRSNGYVGYIPIDENHTLQIEPKVPISNLFRMLEYAYDLKSFELLEGAINIESVEDIFERLVNILAKQILDRNLRGLYRGYIQKTNALPFLRGRIQKRETTFSILRGSPKLFCRYEEHTADLVENQILAWTLYQLRYLPIQKDDVRRRVRLAYRELVNKVSIRSIEPRECINRFYNRLNQDYKPMHALCRFFLEHMGPGLERGNYDFIPFVIHMPTLFESFVAKWLEENLPPKYMLETQYVARLDTEGQFSFKIDLVLVNSKTGKTEGVLDAKYKRTEQPEQEDYMQIVAYAESMLTTNAFLIYPSTHTKEFQFPVGNVQVRGLIFDSSKDLQKAGTKFLNSIIRGIG